MLCVNVFTELWVHKTQTECEIIEGRAFSREQQTGWRGMKRGGGWGGGRSERWRTAGVQGGPLLGAGFPAVPGQGAGGGMG